MSAEVAAISKGGAPDDAVRGDMRKWSERMRTE